MTDAALIERLSALTKHADDLSAPAPDSDAPSDPYLVLIPFIQAAYDHAWVSDTFDWQAWEVSEEATELLDNPAALAAASSDQLKMILTLLIKKDRVVQGSLEDAYENGLLADCATRASSLLESIQ